MGKKISLSPMMSNNEQILVNKYIRPNHIMLEWGSGASTIWFVSIVKSLTSIEHNPKWYKLVVNLLEGLKNKRGHIDYYLVHPNKPRTKPTKREQFKDYIEIVHKLEVPHYDIVMIDGRARKWCAEEVLPYINKDSLVFIHDFFCRPRYHDVLEYYDEYDSVEQMVVLKKK